MVRFGAVYCFTFVFGQIILLTGINAYLNEFTTTIVDENRLETQLKWTKTEQTLANNHLPIWVASPKKRLTQHKEVMMQIGNFETYYDLNKSSAVVYFEKSERLYGIIDTSYLIIGLPVKKLHKKHIIGKSRYIISPRKEKLSFQDSMNNYISYYRTAENSTVSSTFSVNSKFDKTKIDNENSTDKSLGPFYPEILLFIPYHSVDFHQRIRSRYPHLVQYVLYCIVHMNAVAMLFAKLSKDVKIHINIAAIILEEEEGAFPFTILQSENSQLQSSTNQLILKSITRYINTITNGYNYEVFYEDSFDFFLFQTTSNHILEPYSGIFQGVSAQWFDVFKWRALHKNSKIDTNFLGSVVNNSNILQSYVNSAREIAHLMTINDDQSTSHTIMQKNRLNYSSDCLKWSTDSIKSFKEYFSQNKNRCYLLNEPRSLYDYDVPRETISPAVQCECYGFVYRTVGNNDSVSTSDPKYCRRRLRCQKTRGRNLYEKTKKKSSVKHLKLVRKLPRPVDGTPCAKDKVCLRRRCVPGVMRMKPTVQIENECSLEWD